MSELRRLWTRIRYWLDPEGTRQRLEDDLAIRRELALGSMSIESVCEWLMSQDGVLTRPGMRQMGRQYIEFFVPLDYLPPKEPHA